MISAKEIRDYKRRLKLTDGQIGHNLSIHPEQIRRYMNDKGLTTVARAMFYYYFRYLEEKC